MRGALIAGALFLWALSQGTLAETAPVNLGFIAPLTGPFADWGESIRRGVGLALEDAKTPFAVDYQDDRCEAAQAVSIAQRFFDIRGIRFVLGPGCDHCLIAIAPAAARRGALLFSTGLLGEDVLGGYSNVVNLAAQISSEAARLGRQISADGRRRAAVVHGSNTFGVEYARRLAEELKARGIEVEAEETRLGSTDFRPLVVRLLRNKPDAVFIHQGEQEIIAFVRQLRAADADIQVYSQYGFETRSIREAAAALSGVIYTYPLNAAEATAAKAAFDRRFSAKFGPGAMPSATSYYVYDGLLFLDQALQRCGAEDAACVADFFKSLGPRDGISGKMIFRADGGLDRQYGIKQLQRGNFRWISKDP